MRALATRALESGGAPAAVGEGGLSLISSSPAFEFFELWKAGHDDLLRIVCAQLCGTCGLIALVLGVGPALLLALCMTGSLGSMLIVLDQVFSVDLNMVTAVNVLLFVPCTTDFFFHLCFRATAFGCLPRLDSSHRDNDDMTSIRRARLVAIVVLPGFVAFGVTVGLPLWLLLLCSSPLNSLFAFLYQASLLIQAGFALFVLLPVLVSDGYGQAFSYLQHLGWSGEKAFWALLTPRRMARR